MLRLHRQDLLGIEVQVGQQHRPQHLVLAGVVGVQADGVQPPVFGEDPGSGGVGGAHVLDEFDQQARLSAEHLVDHRHLTGVGVDGGAGSVARSHDTQSSGFRRGDFIAASAKWKCVSFVGLTPPSRGPRPPVRRPPRGRQASSHEYAVRRPPRSDPDQVARLLRSTSGLRELVNPRRHVGRPASSLRSRDRWTKRGRRGPRSGLWSLRRPGRSRRSPPGAGPARRPVR